MGRPGTVYLLHFNEPHPRGKHPRHYLGWARNVANRTRDHALRRSHARLVEVMIDLGLYFDVALEIKSMRVRDRTTGKCITIRGRRLERHLKRRGHYRDLCPMCRGADHA